MDAMKCRKKFEELWGKATPTEIANQCGVSRAAVYQRARTLRLPSMMEMDLPDVEKPTADEIAAMTASIRARWSDEEERRRLVGARQSGRRWTPPNIEIGMIEAPTYSRI